MLVRVPVTKGRREVRLKRQLVLSSRTSSRAFAARADRPPSWHPCMPQHDSGNRSKHTRRRAMQPKQTSSAAVALKSQASQRQQEPGGLTTAILSSAGFVNLAFTSSTKFSFSVMPAGAEGPVASAATRAHVRSQGVFC